MEYIFNLVAIVQLMAISLGVGSSTMAILNFFAAIRDGHIDESERNMMGIVYVVLRVSMVLILITTAILTINHYVTYNAFFASNFEMLEWVIIAVLYLNAILMTKHIMPSTIGPALQAGSWYTLGLVTALISVGVVSLPLATSLALYAAVVTFAVVIVNGAMSYLKHHRR